MTKIADTMQDNGSMLHNQGPWGGRSGGGSGNNGNNGGGQNPWGQRPNRPDQDPDLDNVLRQAQDRFKSAFGDRGAGGNPFNPGKAILAGIGIAAALWLSTGFYRVLPEEDAVIMTFGKWTSTRDESGLGYALPWPIQEVNKVNVGFDRRVEVGFREQTSTKNTRAAASSSDVPFESLMLTGDENIIDINFVVLWRISDAGKYLFKIRDPKPPSKRYRKAPCVKLSGRPKSRRALNEARGQVETDTKVLIQKILDEYQAGVTINSVQLLRVDPPEQVVDAFDDVQTRQGRQGALEKRSRNLS
jgi:membrane protease subunit HflK